jgi:hypothetical protein
MEYHKAALEILRLDPGSGILKPLALEYLSHAFCGRLALYGFAAGVVHAFAISRIWGRFLLFIAFIAKVVFRVDFLAAMTKSFIHKYYFAKIDLKMQILSFIFIFQFFKFENDIDVVND